jgi:hypothetical protein
MCDHRFVGGDKGAPGGNRVARERQRWPVAAADQFDDNVDIVASGKLCRIVNPIEAGQINTAIAPPITRRDSRDCHRSSCTPRNQVAIGVKQFDHTDTNGAKAGKGNAQSYRQGFIPEIMPTLGIQCGRKKPLIRNDNKGIKIFASVGSRAVCAIRYQARGVRPTPRA